MTDIVLAKATLTTASEAAQRYASALFELAQDKGQLADVHRDFKSLCTLIHGNEDLLDLVVSPAYSREDKSAALTEIAKAAGANTLVANFVGVMGQNGRARDILGAQTAFDQLYANQRGVKRATVRTAEPMSAEQRDRITSMLQKVVGNTVEVTEEVDEALIGGIQLRIGSQLVDASIASKLDRMNAAMKGA